jgi:ribosomal protein L37AE/L43A
LISGDFQTFEDIESSEDERDIRLKKAAASSGAKTKRTKECPGCGAVLALSVRECRLCDYQFTSKSMLVTTQSAHQESVSIRERFPFEPERVSSLKLIYCITCSLQQTNLLS